MRISAPITVSALIVAGLLIAGSGVRHAPPLTASQALSASTDRVIETAAVDMRLVPAAPSPARTLRAMTPPADGTVPPDGSVPLQNVSVPAGAAMGIPSIVLAAYRNADLALRTSDPKCGLTWNLLAGIGKIESDHAGNGRTDANGTTLAPIYGPALDGTLPGNEVIKASDGSFVRAVGPMQFLPGTWYLYASDGRGAGHPDPNNVFDAALAAGKYLCAGGMDLGDPKQELRAVLRYNNSLAYAALVLSWSNAYRTGGVPTQVELSPDGVPPGGMPQGAGSGMQLVSDVQPLTSTTTPTATTTTPTPTTTPATITPTTTTPTVTPTDTYSGTVTTTPVSPGITASIQAGPTPGISATINGPGFQVTINIQGLPPIPCGIFCAVAVPDPCAPLPIPQIPQPDQPGRPIEAQQWWPQALPKLADADSLRLPTLCDNPDQPPPIPTSLPQTSWPLPTLPTDTTPPWPTPSTDTTTPWPTSTAPTTPTDTSVPSSTPNTPTWPTNTPTPPSQTTTSTQSPTTTTQPVPTPTTQATPTTTTVQPTTTAPPTTTTVPPNDLQEPAQTPTTTTQPSTTQPSTSTTQPSTTQPPTPTTAQPPAQRAPDSTTPQTPVARRTQTTTTIPDDQTSAPPVPSTTQKPVAKPTTTTESAPTQSTQPVAPPVAPTIDRKPQSQAPTTEPAQQKPIQQTPAAPAPAQPPSKQQPAPTAQKKPPQITPTTTPPVPRDRSSGPYPRATTRRGARHPCECKPPSPPHRSPEGLSWTRGRHGRNVPRQKADRRGRRRQRRPNPQPAPRHRPGRRCHPPLPQTSARQTEGLIFGAAPVRSRLSCEPLRWLHQKYGPHVMTHRIPELRQLRQQLPDIGKVRTAA
ncbi:lytic transglycosylase domain-containing protein [Nocardia terpenica]|uniref:lytic transglycosylase domain-containing protein n=1 Tax=Nocardia terpenica TaxID=455432 RepID=UPI003183C6ED